MKWRAGEDDAGLEGFMGGSATTLNTDGKAPRRTREFPPGFHGANPGPSHDDEAPRPRRAPRPTPPRKKRK